MVMVTELHNRRVIRVPDVVGHPLTKARMLMANAGLAVDAVLYRESYERKDTVLEQTPARGQMVYEGSRITLYVARRGYMELLPAIYRRSDAVGRNLVREICFIFEHMFGSVDETLERGHTYYDPLECPPEFLPWLASWTAMVLDVGWPIEKTRALLKRSVDLYRIRGTTRGLALFLKLFIGHEPIIEENKWPFRGFRVGIDARVGIDSVVLPPVNLAHCFTVTIPIKFTDVTPEMVVRVHEIIQMEKPAHVQYYLRFAADEGDAQLREFFAIGLRSGIGISDEIVHATEEPVLEEAHESSATVPTAPMLAGGPALAAPEPKTEAKAEAKKTDPKKKKPDKPDKTGK
jgi:phage tail-like protein